MKEKNTKKISNQNIKEIEIYFRPRAGCELIHFVIEKQDIDCLIELLNQMKLRY